jgi:hypothetical protein
LALSDPYLDRAVGQKLGDIQYPKLQYQRLVAQDASLLVMEYSRAETTTHKPELQSTLKGRPNTSDASPAPALAMAPHSA